MSEADVRQAFRDQAAFCERSGTPVTAAVVRALGLALDSLTETGRRALGWPGDPRGSADSIALRLAGGMHALARRNVNERLARLYAGHLDEAEEIVAEMLRRHDAELAAWLDSPPQTNETGRAAPIMAGLMLLAAEYRLPFELFELGASAGLNLNMDRFGFQLGEAQTGDPGSPVQLSPIWEGGGPVSADVQVIRRRGVDQNPLRVTDSSDRERLIAYCWPDQPERMARLQSALAIADLYPPPLEKGDAADFAERWLGEARPEGVTRVLYHTIFWTYLPPQKQDRVRAALAQAGEAATIDRPLAWLRYELAGNGVAELHLQQWPGGRERHLATGHPHGSRIVWRG